MKLKFWQREAGSAPSAPAETGTEQRRPRGLRSLAHMFKASFTDKNDKWAATPISPDVFITLRQPILVARSREQWSNNDYVKGFIRQVRQNVVGSHGVKLQAKVRKPRGALDKDVNAAIEAAWKDFGRKGNLDVTGKLSWRELQCLAIETMARDGEFIIRVIRGRGPHLLQLQMLDPQRLSVKYENYKYGNNGNFIR
ncbi:MAG: phage portal protein, partial [Achromobacter mucicolens]